MTSKLLTVAGAAAVVVLALGSGFALRTVMDARSRPRRPRRRWRRIWGSPSS